MIKNFLDKTKKNGSLKKMIINWFEFEKLDEQQKVIYVIYDCADFINGFINF